MRRFLLLPLLAGALLLGGPTLAFGHRVATTVEIGLSDIRLRADFYPAGSARPAPAVILLHGWSWPDSTPARDLAPVARRFQAQGYAVLVPTLRGWPPTGGVDDCAGRQVGDVLQALAWLAEQPGVDAQRRFLVGYSLGGQIALLAAGRGAPVRALAAYAPVVEPRSWYAQTEIEGIRDYLRHECGGAPGWRSRDVLARAETLRQPLLLVHGDADRRVPSAQSLNLYRRLRALERPAQLQLLRGVDHSRDALLQAQLAIDFFRRHDPPTVGAAPAS